VDFLLRPKTQALPGFFLLVWERDIVSYVARLSARNN